MKFEHQFIKLRIDCILALDAPRVGLPVAWMRPEIAKMVSAGLAAAGLDEAVVGVMPHAKFGVGLWSPKPKRQRKARGTK